MQGDTRTGRTIASQKESLGEPGEGEVRARKGSFSDGDRKVNVEGWRNEPPMMGVG